MISNLLKALSIGVDLEACVKHPSTTQEDNWKAARAAFDYPVEPVIPHPSTIMEDNDSLPFEAKSETDAERSEIWAMRVKYNTTPYRRDLLRANLVNVLHQRGHDDDEIRRLLQVYDLFD